MLHPKRARTFAVACLWLGLGSSCASPLMAAPLFMPKPQPLAYALPTDDGATYVLVEARRGATERQLVRRWQQEANRACEGDYVVLSENESQRNRGGKTLMRIYEGYVRCVNPEANEALELPTRS